jgi:hypothetical protein
MITCPQCHGQRTYDVETRKMHGGQRCGKTITLTYPCKRCKGSGRMTTNAGDLDIIFQGVAAKALIDSDRASGG